MDTWQRRTALYVLELIGVILGFAAAYDYGMTAFDGRPRTFIESLQVVVETFTTTGYGSDAKWESTEMLLLVTGMDIVGVVLIFLALPVLLFPLFEEAMSTTVPTAVEEELEDHVVICSFTPRGETLVGELDTWEVDHVIVEPDRERATDLYEDGHRVVHADPQSVKGLEAAGLSRARSLVADAADEINTSIILTASEVDDSVPTVSVVKEPDRERYHELAGTDHVLSPRRLLGESLASKVTTRVSTAVGDTIEIGQDFDIAELPIHRGSELVGRTLADSDIREQASVNVIGAWFQGEFESPPSPEATLDNGTVLLVAGREDQLQRLKDMTLSNMRQFGRGETVVVGYGEVGETIGDALDSAGLSYSVIDQVEKPGVDVVGDAAEPDELRAAGVEDARTVILALSDDTSMEFATLVVQDLNPHVEIIARAEQTENVQKMYRAGADYVLSLATVSGRMLASTILADEQVISMDEQVEIVRTQADELAGQTLGEARVRARTGCTVVAVERNGDVITDVGPSVHINADDDLVVAGTDESVDQFRAIFN